MSLVVGVDTWTTVIEADSFLEDRIGTSAWFSLDTEAGPGLPSKEIYLKMSFQMLVNKPEYCLDPSITDENVKRAQSELAFYFVDNYDTFMAGAEFQNKGVISFKLSKWWESYASSHEGGFALPATVSMYLNDYRSDNLIVSLKVE